MSGLTWVLGEHGPPRNPSTGELSLGQRTETSLGVGREGCGQVPGNGPSPVAVSHVGDRLLPLGLDVLQPG